jgi:hypothetical protein
MVAVSVIAFLFPSGHSGLSGDGVSQFLSLLDWCGTTSFFCLAGTLVCSMVCLRKKCKAYAIDGDDAGGVAKTHILSLVACPWALSAALVTSDPSELLETPIR